MPCLLLVTPFLSLFKINPFKSVACTTLQGPHPHLCAAFPHFLPTLNMRCREPPCAVAPNLMPCRVHMQVELIPLRPGARRGHCAPRGRPPGDSAYRSNPRAIYTTWAPSWLSRRGPVRLTYVSIEKIIFVCRWRLRPARRGRAAVLSPARGAHFC